MMTPDELKRLNLVELLERNWHMAFVRLGSCFQAISPFTAETNPSFFVSRADDGHWIYCDHSDGSSGTIIDLMMRRHGISDFRQACAAAGELAGVAALKAEPPPVAAPEPAQAQRDWTWLYERLQGNDPAPSRQYLLGRGVAAELVAQLTLNSTLLLNRADGSNYCCFAVRNATGELISLYNRLIDGPADRAKFWLGAHQPFCTDWNQLSKAATVYLCEGIIDALSLQTLLPEACVLAVPSANFAMAQLQLPADAYLIDAFDNDAAGRAAGERLRRAFPRHRMQTFDLSGAADLNEFLRQHRPMAASAAGDRGAGKLSVKDKVAIALDGSSSRQLADKYSVHHSSICKTRQEAGNILAAEWGSRHPGPKPKTIENDAQELARKDHKIQEQAREIALLTMRKEWLELQLKIQAERDEEVEKGRCALKRKKKRRKKTK